MALHARQNKQTSHVADVVDAAVDGWDHLFVVPLIYVAARHTTRSSPSKGCSVGHFANQLRMVGGYTMPVDVVSVVPLANEGLSMKRLAVCSGRSFGGNSPHNAQTE